MGDERGVTSMRGVIGREDGGNAYGRGKLAGGSGPGGRSAPMTGLTPPSAVATATAPVTAVRGDASGT